VEGEKRLSFARWRAKMRDGNAYVANDRGPIQARRKATARDRRHLRTKKELKTMAPLTNFLVLATVGAAAAFAPAQVARPKSSLSESFGFDFAEDSYANTPDVLTGEANYKQWVKRVDENSFLNRKVCFICCNC
jgi:hypothetical protein